MTFTFGIIFSYTGFLTEIKMNLICKLVGHWWRYKDYSTWIMDNGDKYPFKAARRCARCNRNEYFYTEWIQEAKNYKLDIQHDKEMQRETPIMG
ncbi:MAG: hypothetical protein ABI723_07465 [Bacteroidia bacterium]